MDVQEVEISTLSPDPANLRRHTEAQIAKLVAALKRWGQTLPLLVDQNNLVRIGNARLEAMNRLGWQKVKVVRLDLSPSEWTALSIADNKLHDDSDFDQDALARTLESLRTEDNDLAEAAGFTAQELAELLSPPAPPEPPSEFQEFGEDIATDHECPKCHFRWSGKAGVTNG